MQAYPGLAQSSFEQLDLELQNSSLPLISCSGDLL